MKIILIQGDENTGKTTLCNQIDEWLQRELLREKGINLRIEMTKHFSKKNDFFAVYDIYTNKTIKNPEELNVFKARIFINSGSEKLCITPFERFYKNENGKLPLTVNGKLKAGNYEIDGNISSQFITGLLYALPLLDGDSKLTINKNLESKGYVDLTLEILKLAGIEIMNNDYKSFDIRGNQIYKPFDYTVEGDYSQVAFWIVAGIISANRDNEVKCLHVNKALKTRFIHIKALFMRDARE